MISNSDKISRKEEINELFEQLGNVLEQRVEALLIGGAVMLELGLKDATKDIDVVCRNEVDKDRLLAAAKALGFEIVGPEKRHERLGVKRLAVKGGRNLDVFAGRISYDFDLSEAIWQRATRIRSFGSLVIRDASMEDIFIMKLIANRPGDAPDCFGQGQAVAQVIGSSQKGAVDFGAGPPENRLCCSFCFFPLMIVPGSRSVRIEILKYSN
jgi:hypothetical protein